MRYWIQGAWWALALMLVLSGCGKPQGPPQQESEPAAAPAFNEHDLELPGPETKDQAAQEAPAKPAAPPKVPDVVMTEALAATCRVKVGDLMPEGELPDLDGKPHSLKSLFGSKLTIVLFWNAENLYAVQELQDLQIDVVEPYGQQGANVVAINEKNSAEAVREKVDQAGAKYPQLLDSDGSYFAKVATEKLPRTYLLDSEGKILWFDLEYSPSTRRNLLQAIQVALGK